jgi:hypothetical protein
MPIQIGPKPLGSRHAVFDLCRVSNRQSPALLDDGRIHQYSVNVCKHSWQPLVRVSTYRSQSCARWYCGFIPPWTDFNQLLLSRSPESKLHLRRLKSDCLYERAHLADRYKSFFPTDITPLFNERKNNREKKVLSSICRADVEQVYSRRRSRIVARVCTFDDWLRVNLAPGSGSLGSESDAERVFPAVGPAENGPGRQAHWLVPARRRPALGGSHQLR